MASIRLMNVAASDSAIAADYTYVTGANVGRIWGFDTSPPALPAWGSTTWNGSVTFIDPNI
jgi:hypothetical protein